MSRYSHRGSRGASFRWHLAVRLHRLTHLGEELLLLDAPVMFSGNYERKTSYAGAKAALKTLHPGDRQMRCKFLEDDYDDKGREWGGTWMIPEPEDTEEGKADTTKEGHEAISVFGHRNSSPFTILIILPRLGENELHLLVWLVRMR
ncbi:hypothetical protein ACHAXR_010258 [Thalassiosira sp. AJA248-18]